MKRVKQKQIHAALEKVAVKHNSTTQSVHREIELAIKIARKSEDPAVQAEWAKIPCAGKFPIVEEIIAYLAKSVATNR